MEAKNQSGACRDCGCPGAHYCPGKPIQETGVNKQWAQGKLTEKKDKPLKKSDKPITKETLEFTPTTSSFNADTGVFLKSMKDGRIGIVLDGTEVGEIWIEGKTLRFKGNVDDSAAVLLIALKRYIDNWLKMKDK